MFIKSSPCGNTCCGFSFKKSTQAFALVDLLISMLIAISLMILLFSWRSIEKQYFSNIIIENSTHNASSILDAKTNEDNMEILTIIQAITIAALVSTMIQFFLAIVLIFSTISESKKGCILWMVLTLPLLPLSPFVFKIMEICIVCSFLHELDQHSNRTTSDPKIPRTTRRKSLNSISLDPTKLSPRHQPQLSSAVFISPPANPTSIIYQPPQPSSVIISTPAHNLPILSYQYPSDTLPVVHENKHTTINSTITNVNCGTLSISSSSSDNSCRIVDLEHFYISSDGSLNENIKSIESTESIGIELESIKSDDMIEIGNYENDLGALTYENPCGNEENQITFSVEGNEFVEDDVESVIYDYNIDTLDIHGVNSILINDCSEE